jgi:hypothetical protein
VAERRVNPTATDPVLLIVDGHASHNNLVVILFARSHHVHMLSLPPHTTHKLQPLDRDITKPFKNAFNEACAQWMPKYSYLKIGVKDITGLVNIAFTKICRIELAKSAFACTGNCSFKSWDFLRFRLPFTCGAGCLRFSAR